MSKEVVKIFTDVTDKELKTLLGRIKKHGRKMTESWVEVEEYTLERKEREDRRWSQDGFAKIQGFYKYRKRFAQHQAFNKVTWHYVV